MIICERGVCDEPHSSRGVASILAAAAADDGGSPMFMLAEWVELPADGIGLPEKLPPLYVPVCIPLKFGVDMGTPLGVYIELGNPIPALDGCWYICRGAL